MGGGTGNYGQVGLAQPGYAQGMVNYGGGYGMNGGMMGGGYNGMTPYAGTQPQQQMGGYQQQVPWQLNPYQQYNLMQMMQPRRGLFNQQWSEGNSNYGGGMGESLNRPVGAVPAANYAGSGNEEVLAPLVKKPVVINYENGGGI